MLKYNLPLKLNLTLKRDSKVSLLLSRLSLNPRYTLYPTLLSTSIWYLHSFFVNTCQMYYYCVNRSTRFLQRDEMRIILLSYNRTKKLKIIDSVLHVFEECFPSFQDSDFSSRTTKLVRGQTFVKHCFRMY